MLYGGRCDVRKICQMSDAALFSVYLGLSFMIVVGQVLIMGGIRDFDLVNGIWGSVFCTIALATLSFLVGRS